MPATNKSFSSPLNPVSRSRYFQGAGGFCVYVMRFALASCNSLAVRTYRFFAWFDVAPLVYAIRLQRGIRLAGCRGMQVERLANLCRGGAAVAHEVIRVQKRTPERLLVCSGVHLPDALTPGFTFCRSFSEVTTTSQILPWPAIRCKRDIPIYAGGRECPCPEVIGKETSPRAAHFAGHCPYSKR